MEHNSDYLPAHHRQYAPDPALAEYVLCLWTAQHAFRAPDDWFDVLPDSYIELTFNIGSRCLIDDGQSVRALPRCCVIGLLEQPLRLRADGPCRTVGARFFAWGFYPLLGRGTASPAGAVQPLDATWHQLTDRIEQAVLRGDDHAAVAQLQAFLMQCVEHTHNDLTTSRAASRLFQHDGQVKIGDLASGAYLSQRQLERRFNKTVGETPKALARRIRFQHVRDRLWFDPSTDLAALALQCGYADQAHCIREFKRFSNRTPRQFATEMAATRQLLSPSGVVFVQDL